MDGGADTERKERERAFHDDRFTVETRDAADKYYAVDAGKARYKGLVQELGSGARVLEYGCGIGSEAFDLAARGSKVVGIDISPVAIAKSTEEARRQGLDAEFLEMDAESLKFDPGSFDLVCGSGILHHLVLERAYREVARVLRPDGQAVFMEPMGHNPLINLYRRLTPSMRTEDEHPLVMDDFKAAERHFGQVDLEFFNLATIAAAPMRNLPGSGSLLRRLRQLDGWLFEHSSIARKWAWIVVMRLGLPR